MMKNVAVNALSAVAAASPEVANSMLLNFKDNKKAKDVIEFLKVQNMGPPVEVKLTKTLVMMDATGSMYSLLQKVKDKIQEMLSRI